MRQITLTVVPSAPEGASIIEKDPASAHSAFLDASKAPDRSEIEWVCGGCGDPLIIGLRPGSVTDVFLRCRCGALNDATI